MQAMTEGRLRETVLRGLGGARFEEGSCPCSSLFLPVGTWKAKARDGRLALEAGAVRFSVSRAGVKSRKPSGYLRGEECYERIRQIIEAAVSESQ